MQGLRLARPRSTAGASTFHGHPSRTALGAPKEARTEHFNQGIDERKRNIADRPAYCHTSVIPAWLYGICGLAPAGWAQSPQGTRAKAAAEARESAEAQSEREQEAFLIAQGNITEGKISTCTSWKGVWSFDIKGQDVVQSLCLHEEVQCVV